MFYRQNIVRDLYLVKKLYSFFSGESLRRQTLAFASRNCVVVLHGNVCALAGVRKNLGTFRHC